MHVSAEIPLLFFTLLGQMAVGIILVGQCALAGNTAASVRMRVQNQSLFALLFIGAAAILSTLHLGTPLHAPFTLLHAGTSWLSREIIMVILTAASLAALIYFRWRRPDSKIAGILSLVACALGVLLIYAMSKVYNSPFLPGWAGDSTFFMFLASALILGSLWQACAIGTSNMKEESQPAKNTLWRIFFLALGGFVLFAIFLPGSMPENVPGINPNSFAASEESISSLQGLHAFLSGLGILLFLAALWRGLSEKPSAGILIVALLLAIGGEVAGRFAFYMSYAKLGM